MPHSFLFGHLWTIAKISIKNKVPPDVHSQNTPKLPIKEYPEIRKAGAFYMDVWPVSQPLLVVFDPEMMAQFTQDQSQLKHPWELLEFRPFTGNQDLVTTEGREWKTYRAIFNPGFSARNLLSLIPSFVEEALVFRKRLGEAAAKGDVITLEEYTTSLTVDIIGRAVLGGRLRAQEKPVRLMEAMLSQVGWLYFQNDLLKMFNPLKPFYHKFYNRVFREELMPFIKHTAENYEKITGPKTILNLALKSYVSEVDESARSNIPPAFLDRVVNHVKMFIMAGHDTTASTLAFAYYELSKNRDKLATLREELDAVLGPDTSQAAERITADPTLLNQMPYTLGVVKETLRLWPPTGTVRLGEPNMILRNSETGVQYPAKDFILFACSAASHRHPDLCKCPWSSALPSRARQTSAYPVPLPKEDTGMLLFSPFRRLLTPSVPGPEADKFIPERFLVRDEADPMHPVKNAFRPWEMGPRNCIGQELASLELRLILALTAREFEVETAYPESAPTYQGQQVYQAQLRNMLTGHASMGLPVRVRQGRR